MAPTNVKSQSPELYRVQQVVVHTNGKKCMRFTTFAGVPRGAHSSRYKTRNTRMNADVDFMQVAFDTSTPALLSAAHRVTGMCAHTQGLLESFVKSAAVSVSKTSHKHTEENNIIRETNAKTSSLVQNICVQRNGNSEDESGNTACVKTDCDIPTPMQVNDSHVDHACCTEQPCASHQYCIKHGDFEWHCYLSNMCLSQTTVQDMIGASATQTTSHYAKLQIIQVCAHQHTQCADYEIHSLLEPPVVGAHAPVKHTTANNAALQYFRVHCTLFASGHNSLLSKACAMRFCAGAGFKLPANLLAVPAECTRKQQDSAVWYDSCDLMRNLHLNSVPHETVSCFLPIFNTYMIQTHFKLDGEHHALVASYMPFTVRRTALPCAAPTGIPTIKQTPKRRNCSTQSSKTKSKSVGLVTRASGSGAR